MHHTKMLQHAETGNATSWLDITHAMDSSTPPWLSTNIELISWADRMLKPCWCQSTSLMNWLCDIYAHELVMTLNMLCSELELRWYNSMPTPKLNNCYHHMWTDLCMQSSSTNIFWSLSWCSTITHHNLNTHVNLLSEPLNMHLSRPW